MEVGFEFSRDLRIVVDVVWLAGVGAVFVALNWLRGRLRSAGLRSVNTILEWALPDSIEWVGSTLRQLGSVTLLGVGLGLAAAGIAWWLGAAIELRPFGVLLFRGGIAEGVAGAYFGVAFLVAAWLADQAVKWAQRLVYLVMSARGQA